ncbi:hypothetical protein GSI_10110 [Ganoderma sinense ZZ0214-1]|uniref:Uncharacterized protein n=1 Tax=Ganoderma sinense ZZ0214-1 TaxID=1077348 RepID=A0A2G8RZN0_9APHY|nr:hypothetical protein GSI_10110 [Ganoderma sinense ZZ0214-1]
MLISRFLLDLQEAYQRKVIFLGSEDRLHTSHSGSSHLSSVGFNAPALGALCATIELADSVWDQPDGDDEDAHAGLQQPDVYTPQKLGPLTVYYSPRSMTEMASHTNNATSCSSTSGRMAEWSRKPEVRCQRNGRPDA